MNQKAQSMGIDLDEFEMVLDARLVKLQKAEQEKTTSSAPKSNKFGDVKKCPACGAMVQSYQGSCQECGYAFENVEANSSVQNLSKKLNKSNSKDTILEFPIPTTVNFPLRKRRIKPLLAFFYRPRFRKIAPATQKISVM